jgi:hypothetical protein
MKNWILILAGSIVFSSAFAQEKIDRGKLVRRHTIHVQKADA